MKNYSATPMAGISEDDYDALVVHLGEQLAAAFQAQRGGADDSEARGWCNDALANTWQPEITANEWLARAGKRLDLDTSRCVGA